MNDFIFWDVGEEEAVRPSKAHMAAIMLALVRCKGRLYGTHSMELTREGDWRYPTSACAIVMRIALPKGQEARFTELSGFQLTKPPVITVN